MNSVSHSLRRVVLGHRMMFLLPLMLCLSALQAKALTVESRHPRLFFYADSLTAIRQRFTGSGPGAGLFATYKTYVDGYFNSTNRSIYYTPDYACLYLITQNPAYAAKAISIAMQSVREGNQLRNEGGGPARSSCVVIVYDWCFDRLAQAQRDSITNAVYTQHQTWDGRGMYAWQPKDTQWHYMLGIAGDCRTGGSPDAAKNAFVLSKLQDSINQLDDFFLPCMEALRPKAAMDGYSWQKLSYLYLFRDCLLHDTDYRGPALSSIFLAEGPQHWLQRLHPVSSSQIHSYSPTRAPGKYNPQFMSASYMAFFASRYGFTLGQTIANTLVASMDNSDMPDGLGLMLWYNPRLATAPLASAPRDYYDPVMGWVIARSGWDLSSSSVEGLVSFFNTPNVEYGEGRAQSHFTVSRGPDNLLIDSGCYGRDDDDCFPAYYQKAIAHNVVTIYDPAEVFAAHTNSWGNSHPTPNDGGQNVFDLTCGGNGNAWPRCTVSDSPGIACRGTITAYDPEEDYVLVESDATPSYGAAKAVKVLRRFVYLRRGWILIQDHVQLAKPNLEVRDLFHCVDRPSVNKQLVALEGRLDQGGVFQSLDADRLDITKGNSMARIYVLRTEGGQSEIRLVGGPSTSGEHWKQNIDSRDTYSYVSSLADQSYEFYVDGKNYAPGGRDESYLREHRNDSNVDAAGDWRIEHLVHTNGYEVNTAYLIQITNRGAQEPSVTVDQSKAVPSVTVVDAGRPFNLPLSKVGETWRPSDSF